MGGGAAGNALSGLAYDHNNDDIYVTNFGSNEQPGNPATIPLTTSLTPDTQLSLMAD